MLLKEAETPLFEACGQRKNSHLSSVLMFLIACTTHQVTNIFQDELFRLLGCEIFLENNVMPKSRYETRKLVSSLGLNYTSIHACEQGCILYHKENKDLLVCLICKVSRYVEGSEIIPCKVLQHFHLILCLKRMYWCKNITQLMQWHEKHSSKDGMVWFVVDSKARKHIDAMWLNFTKDQRNLCFALATNGMNPFGEFNFKHST